MRTPTNESPGSRFPARILFGTLLYAAALMACAMCAAESDRLWRFARQHKPEPILIQDGFRIAG